MQISGSGIKDTNVVFRMLVVIIAGFAAFAVLVSWRAQAFVNAQYQEFPKSHKTNQIMKVQTSKPDINPDMNIEKQNLELPSPQLQKQLNK